MRIIAVCLILLLGACSQTATVNKSWVAEDLHDQDFNGVLVVANSEKESTRSLFETNFTAALEKEDVQAVASHTLTGGAKVTKENVVGLGDKAGVDTVLVTSFAGRDNSAVLHPGRTYYGRRPVYGGGYYGRGRVYSVPYEVGQTADFWAEHKSVYLEASLYAIATEELLWRASAGIEDKGDVDSMLKAFIDSFVDQMVKENLLD